MAQEFTDAVKSGLRKEGISYDYSSPDYDLFTNLRESCYHFSAAKSWNVNKDLTELLYDGDTRRSFSEFQKAAQDQLNVVIGQYGKIEWNSAHSVSQIAAKEMRFSKTKDTMPYVQFFTTESERVCPICAPFNKLIFRIDDAHRPVPALHFQCQCTEVQLPDDDAEPTPEEDIPAMDNVPEMFRGNYAAKQQAFPPEHPYYQNAPKRSIKDWLRKNLPS